MHSNSGTDSKRINILFLPKWYPWEKDPQYGIFVKKHAEAVCHHADVSVLYIQGDEQLEKSYFLDIRKGNITEFIVLYRQDKSPLRKLINTYRYLKATWKGYKLIRDNQILPDICHIHIMTRPALVALLMRIFHGVPYIITEHWTGYTSGAYKEWSTIKKYLHKEILSYSKGITTVSESLKKALHSITAKQIQVIPNVVDDTFSWSPPEQSEKIVILTVADLDDRKKNISGVIKAVGKIYEKHKNFEYHIIGDGKDRKILERLAKKSIPDEGVIQFHGLQSNEYVAAFMKKAHFIVINSNYETFCVIAIEALATGKPVIATRSGGPEEFVREEYGILIEPGDKEALYKSILKMINTYSQYDGRKMSETIKAEFGPEKTGKAFVRLYQNILRKKTV